MFLYKKPQSKVDSSVLKEGHERQSVQKELEMARKTLTATQKALKRTRKKLEVENERFRALYVKRGGTNPPPLGPKPVVVFPSQQSKKKHKRFRLWPFGKG